MDGDVKVPIMVTTEHHGVFFGYGVVSDKETIRIEDARMVVFWPEDSHGICGLANKGPGQGAKIGPRVKAITLRAVTAVFEVSSTAAAAWEREPWS